MCVCVGVATNFRTNEVSIDMFIYCATKIKQTKAVNRVLLMASGHEFEESCSNPFELYTQWSFAYGKVYSYLPSDMLTRDDRLWGWLFVV